MLKTTLIAGLSLTLGFSAPAFADSAEASSESSFVWQPTAGEVIEFDVLRKGNKFGTHSVAFSKSDGKLIVENDIELEVKVGPFRAFYYRHDGKEVWQDGILRSVKSETRKDGDDLSLSAERDGTVLRISGSGFNGEAELPVVPSSHWNIEQLRSGTILSSENGELLEIEVEEVGVETITAGGEEIQATRYRLISDLTVDLWYDEDGRWVKCAFEARGQTIEYVLRG